ncbi:MAG: helix-turn-helix domain-containing protein [Vulcanimicrobiaceae bacterium]
MPPPPQQERSRQTRAALLRAALASFEADGYEATTIEEIARRAKVAVGAFYLHFRSKRQALLVLMDALLAELATVDVPVGVAHTPRDAKAVVVEVVRRALRVDVKYLGAYRAWHEAVLRDPELAAMHAEIDAWTLRRVVGMLQIVARAPGARPQTDVQATARVFNALFWRLTEMRAGEEEAVVQATIGILTHALFADEN